MWTKAFVVLAAIFVVLQQQNKISELSNAVAALTESNTNMQTALNTTVAKMEDKIAKTEKREAVKNLIKNDSHSNHLSYAELTEIAELTIKYSDEFKVPTDLILAVIDIESGFRRRAVSPVGARGIMQIMPATAREIAGKLGRNKYNLFSLRDNIQFGTFYLRDMLSRFDEDCSLAIIAYNAGPRTAMKIKTQRNAYFPAETKAYRTDVMDVMAVYSLAKN